MPSPVVLTEQENRQLQEIFLELYQDAQNRQYYPDGFLNGILGKLESWPTALTLTEPENRAIQVLYEKFDEQLRPYPVLSTIRTFGQDTRQRDVVESILKKIIAAQ